MNKQERLAVIRELIETENFSKQGDLVNALQVRGFKATQATVSRDMDEIGIVKVPVGNGYRYSLSQGSAKPLEQSITPKELVTVLAVTEASQELPQFLSVNVVPGTSRLVKRRLLDEQAEAIFSILADDDTILILAKSHAAADQLREILLSWKES